MVNVGLLIRVITVGFWPVTAWCRLVTRWRAATDPQPTYSILQSCRTPSYGFSRFASTKPPFADSHVRPTVAVRSWDRAVIRATASLLNLPHGLHEQLDQSCLWRWLEW